MTVRRSSHPTAPTSSSPRTPGVGPAGNADIYTMTVDGDDVQLVPTGPLWESRPDWGSAG
ncbi:MAG: hypothetical protein WKF47_19580 [Geodermatophilaceae bacterium]